MSDRYSGESDRSRMHPAIIATLVAIPVVAIVIFIGIAAMRSDKPTDTDLTAMGAPGASDAACARMVEKLPKSFPGFGDRREEKPSGDAPLYQWDPSDEQSGPVQLRCGVDRPTDLSPTSRLQVVDKIQWFQVSTKTDARGSLWYAVDRRPYVAIWLPENSGNGPIQMISTTLAETLPASPIDLGK